MNILKEMKLVILKLIEGICETCFRAGFCHINICLFEKQLIKNAILKSTKTFHDFHYINPSNKLKQMINKKSDDYFFNMDFILRTFTKMYNNIPKYEINLKNSLTMKKYYKVLLRKSLEINQININNVNFSLDVEFDDNDNIMWRDQFKYLPILNQYYKALKKNPIHFEDDKVYGIQYYFICSFNKY